MSKNVIIIGASGHGKVIADIVIKSGDNLIGFLDDDINLQNKEVFLKYKVLGKICRIHKFQEDKDVCYIIGIGNNDIRREIDAKYKLNYYTAIHPSAQIAIDAKIGLGTVVMANAVINATSKIGKCCIINTGAIIEHDNCIDELVHISPNATLSGNVKIGTLTHIGTSVSIKNNIVVTDHCVIGVGSVVVKDITDSGIYVGCPARRMKG